MEETNNNLTPENKSPQNEQNDSHGCLMSIIAVVAVGLIIFLVLYFAVFKPMKDNASNNTNVSGSGQYYDDDDNHDYNIFKTAPEISGEQRLDGIDVSVYCKDDYKLVEIKITLYDKNDAVLDTETLQGRNYSKGNTYKLPYRPSFSTMLQASKYKLSVVKYE